MTRHHGRAAIAAGCLLVITGCTSGAVRPAVDQGLPAKSGPVRLMSFNGCDDELAALRKAAEASVGPYGLPGVASADGSAYPMKAMGVPQGADVAPNAEAAPAAASAAGSATASTPAYSGTNDYVAGVDEPDLVKTDGRRIVTVAGGALEVIDAASHTVTGRLPLITDAGFADQQATMLLNGDHALVLGNAGVTRSGEGMRLLLVDLAGQPTVLSSYTIEGSMIGARQVGSTVRVVLSSQPRVTFAPQSGIETDAQRVAANQAVISQAGLDAWLPHYQETSGAATSTGRVSCAAVSRPATFSGANLLTVLTFDLAASTLGSGNGVSIVADGDTVYGTGPSLYVASDDRWRVEVPMARGGAMISSAVAAAQAQTEIYRFDIGQTGPPKFAAGGTVPGYLLDQYALSEWQGYLRVATTTGTSWAIADGQPAGAQTSSSAVYVLSAGGPDMRLVGHVAGLGVTERIYAVRFMGPVGYVVTFRQTDPLYTLDLSNPANPRVRGSVALTGYSAYLHPVSGTRLIGIGRQADAMGHVGGTQVSLFDVSDLAAPARLATFALAGAVSDAEFDPHAFLYWPASGLVVVPVQSYGAQSGALVLRIDDSGITETGLISQPATGYSSIQRSLIIGQTLWTISATGAMATDLTSLRQQAWLPY